MATISLHGLNDFPKAFGSFIGRENEIHEVSGFIVAPPARLVVLTGAVSGGRTRSVIAVARRLAELAHTLLEACPTCESWQQAESR